MRFNVQQVPGWVSKMGVGVALTGALLLPAKVKADSFFYHFNTVFNGLTPVGGSPWIDASFTDVSPGVVQLTISAVGLVGNEYLSALDLNLNPALAPNKLSFSVINSSGGFSKPTISTGENNFKADGDGEYDVNFVFNSKAAKSFDGGDSITYDITYKNGGLTADDFDFLSKPSAGGSGPLLAAANILGIPGCDSTTSGWVEPCQLTPVPEPGPGSLLALAAVVWAGVLWFPRRVKRA
jgi:hypothetical protein